MMTSACPPCPVCGSLMVPAGAPYRCLNCLPPSPAPLTPASLHHALAQRGASVSASEGRVLVDVLTERTRQDDKWGVQNHPSVDPARVVRSGRSAAEYLTEYYEIPTARRAQDMCQWYARLGRCTWAHIAVEELCEAVEAAVTSDAACREELVQLAAVIVAWLECIDRRASAPPEAR